ncbi:hypothetical protein RvY_08477 [Ramazzottius varieornatus]|uniref:Uncharacterized protein n=1 Tax=Ramazzottius varieornatus TaxID=947166 RepID=A0A1D1V621_RAMVA|nr:hypothetical protein RvY_08477 [Ramazzottius varieornatus]
MTARHKHMKTDGSLKRNIRVDRVRSKYTTKESEHESPDFPGWADINWGSRAVRFRKLTG